MRPEQGLARNGAVPEASFTQLMELAGTLVTTGFLPAAVKSPAQAVAIILTGRELGLGPMQSLRSISIIQGKPELAADLQLSLFHKDGGHSKWVTLSDLEAVLWLKHPNGDEHTESFTMLDAKRAGIAGGQNWQKYPKAMLRSRAITAGLKSVGFEPLTGVYAPGELGGSEVVEGEVVVNERSETAGGDQGARSAPSVVVPKGFNIAGEAIMVGTKRSSPLFGKPLQHLTETQIAEAILWARGQGAEYETWCGCAELELKTRKERVAARQAESYDTVPAALGDTAADLALDARLAKAESKGRGSSLEVER